jgi:hypothetical protein
MTRIVCTAACCVLLLIGCAAAMKQQSGTAAELSRSSLFGPQSLAENRVGLLTPSGSLRYREILSDILVAALRDSRPTMPLVPLHQSLSMINQKGLASDYADLLSNYEKTGILHRQTLEKIGTALGARYLFLPTLVDYNENTFTRISIIGVRFVQTRTTTVKTMLQIWDSVSGEIVWQGTAQATMAGEDIREKPILFEDVARLAWDELVEKLP